ncbi:MAG: FlgD immunoglobulin-like domain containing protein [Candidatus Krumholzibacteriia bacterium]
MPTSRPPLLLCLAALIAALGARADTFTWGHPLPAANPVNAVAFADDAHGWAVGMAGVVLRTADGGDTWDLVPGTWTVLPDLLDVLAVDASVVVAVGGGAGVYRSGDGGLTWTAVAVPHQERLNDLALVAGRLIAVGDGGVVLASADQGLGWTALGSPGDGLLGGQHWFDAQHGLVTAGAFPFWEGFAARTDDGGLTWQPLAEVDALAMRAVGFVDAQTGFLIGDFSAFRTDDGGATWQDVGFVFPPYTRQLMTLPDGSWLVAAFGEGAEIHRSVDGGATWSRAFDNLAHFGVTDLVQLPGGRLVASLASGALITSDDQAATWSDHRQDLTDLGGNTFDHLAMLPDGHGWASGDWSNTFVQEAVLLRTADGGRTWQAAHTPTGWLTFSDLQLRDGQTGFLAGRGFDGVQTRYLARTADGGETWQGLALPGDPSVLRLVSPAPGVVIASAIDANDVNRVWRSDDDGDTWQLATAGLPTTAWLQGLAFLDADTGYISGGFQTSVLYRTTDGGATWQARPAVGLGGHARTLRFTDPDHGLALCSDGVFRTGDGGATWTAVLAGSTWKQLVLDAAGRGHALGHHEGTLMRTEDGGLTWQAQALPWQDWDPRQSESFVYFALGQSDDGVVVGGVYATLLRATFDPSTTAVEPPAAAALRLEAAPNPFNPATVLRFSLPSAADTRLEVYDARGRHVRSLLAGRLAAGEHTVRWDGRDGTGRALPSGVYLVRVRGGGAQAAVKVALVQ